MPRGSPAHAGIDPVGAQRMYHFGGFPRTRGDRPAPQTEQEIVREVPPHTRG